MNSIKLSDIRISGFRGIKNLSVSFDKVSVLTGCNNVGKTTVLKALQLALGNTNFLSQEDFYVDENGPYEKIIIDIRFIPVNENETRINEFDSIWEDIFTLDGIQYENGISAFVGIRSVFDYDATSISFSRKYRSLQYWTPNENEEWQNIPSTNYRLQRESIPFFYIEAQRDIVEDTKIKNSFLGKLLSDVYKSYDSTKIQEIENKITELNTMTIENSSVLSNIQNTLKEIESAIDGENSEVSITPFTKKIRDLNKGVTIHYGTADNSYTMDYHGMGTRSWSSLLTFKSFIQQHKLVAENESIPFYPIITIEEPEAHLHPDAQKKLYKQMAEMPGQKIISTHSPYIAACSDLSELHGLYKKDGNISCGTLNIESLQPNDVRALKQKVIKTKGEIIFSKALVFFEGETEEQALPIFAEKYFNDNPISLGIDFVGVNGCGLYYPFLYLAECFHIPWYIFSDGEDKAIKSVLKAYNKIRNTTEDNIRNIPNIFVIPNNSDFEKMLINDGYQDEIEACLNELSNDSHCVDNYIRLKNGSVIKSVRTNNTCPSCHQNIYTEIRRDFSGPEGREKALDCMMEEQKTTFAPLIADKIVSSSKGLPPLVINLFEKIKEDLNI